jgi:hypothetical protein
MPHVNVANDRWQRAPQSHAIFLLEELIIHLNICCSQTNLLHFNNDFRLQGKPFHQSVIIVFIADDLQTSSPGTLVKRLMSKLTRISRDWRLTTLSNCMKWGKFLMKDSDFPARGLRILCRKSARALHGGPMEPTIGFKGMSGLCTLG